MRTLTGLHRTTQSRYNKIGWKNGPVVHHFCGEKSSKVSVVTTNMGGLKPLLWSYVFRITSHVGNAQLKGE